MNFYQDCSSHHNGVVLNFPIYLYLITNTLFHLPTHRKTSWMLPRSKHWHLTDYVIVRRKDRQDVRVTKTMCGADCRTDHRFVSKLNLCIQAVRRPQGKKVRKRLDVSNQKQDSKMQAFANNICSRSGTLKHSSHNVDVSLTVFRDTVVHPSAMNSLGPISRNTKIGMMRTTALRNLMDLESTLLSTRLSTGTKLYRQTIGITMGTLCSSCCRFVSFLL